MSDSKKQACFEEVTDGESRPGHLTRLQQLYPRMIEKLSAKPVAAVLFQNDILSLAELQKVQCAQTAVDAAEYLLNRLLVMHSEVSYNCFLRALKATNQEHIFLWLTYNDFEIESQHTDLIRQKYTFVVEHLNPKQSGLTALLFQEEVIDQREREFLESDAGAIGQAERLMSVLSRKSKEHFERFLIALDQTGQDQIADELRHPAFLDPSVAGDLKPHHELLSGPTIRASLDDDEAAAGKATENEDPSSRSTADAFAYLMEAGQGRKGSVAAVTVLGDELYVCREKFELLVEVYNATDFTFQRNIEVDAVVNYESNVSGLASCSTNNCLYVSCVWYNGYIVRLELTGSREIIKWEVTGDTARALSVNSQRNVIAACSGRRPHRLIEYTTRGTFVRQIVLQDDVDWPSHAIQLNSNLFLVSHGGISDPLHRVCVVNTHGKVLLGYGNQAGSGIGQLDQPQHLAVDRTGLIYVADKCNNRVVVLDSTLKRLRDLKFAEGVINKPNPLYLDVQRNRLFVGECNGDDSRFVVAQCAD